MATEQERQPIRGLPDTVVCGFCMDCHREIHGHIGVRLVVYRGVPGVEVYLCTSTEMHALGRVELSVLPIVRLSDADSSATA